MQVEYDGGIVLRLTNFPILCQMRHKPVVPHGHWHKRADGAGTLEV